MIVDDHAVIRRMLRAEGVRKALKLKPNLIILDLSMPVMNGLEAARKLKVLMPHVPLLMFTNNADEIQEKEAISAGIVAVVRKSDSDSSKQLVAQATALLGSKGQVIQRVSHPTDKQTAGT
jgi:CheY-like chemotaxis protein